MRILGVVAGGVLLVGWAGYMMFAGAAQQPVGAVPRELDACAVSAVGLAPGGPVVAPMAGRWLYTSGFGPRWGTLHNGVDLAASGSPATLAAAAGTVTFAGPAGNAGLMVVIDHGGGTVTRYMHHASLTVASGQPVKAGQQVGVQGSTGDSTGPHLHFEVHVDGTPVEPTAWLAKAGVQLPQMGGWFEGGGGSVQLVAAPAPAAPSCDPVVAAVNTDAIPAPARAWVMKAGTICQAIPASVVAAQIDAESGWNPDAVSPVGARGPSQFMPGTWAAMGRDDDGNGRIDPRDWGDAIMAQGRYDCQIAAALSGSVSGDVLDLTLAGYNAGPGAVLLHGGVPPYAETREYVAKIKTLAETKYARMGA